MTKAGFLLSIALLASGLAHGACEDEPRPAAPDEARAARVAVERFFAAMVAQDGRAACGLLSGRLRAEYGDPPDPCRREVLYAAVGTEPPRDVVVVSAKAGRRAGRVVVSTRRGHGGGERIERQLVRVVRAGGGPWRVDGFDERACEGSERPAASGTAGLVEVPEADPTPPAARLRLTGEALAGRAFDCSTSSSRFPRGMRVRLGAPRMRATAVGVDADGGMARIRISIEERIRCRTEGGARRRERIRLRYLPPPAIARTRVPPGVHLPAARERSAPLSFAAGRPCGGAGWMLEGVSGRVWADATNAHERESSALARFSYTRD